MAKRIIMRIELTQPAKDSLQEFADRAGMTQFAITSKMMEWLAEQPESIQNAVLNRFPTENKGDVNQQILKRMSNTTPSKK